jgi:hypothetical protein
MLCKSPIAKILWVISLWLGAIVCLDIGLMPLMHGQRFLEIVLRKLAIYDMTWIPLHYVVLAAGIILLFTLITHMGGWKTTYHCGE